MSWIADLNKAMRENAPDEDEYKKDMKYSDDDEEGDEEGDEEEEEYMPPSKTKKGISGTSTSKNTPKPGQKKVDKYEPGENGETTGDDDDDADVADPKSIDRKTGGGPVKFASGKGTKKSLADAVTEETADAIDVSPILGDLAKGIQTLAEQGEAQAAGVAAEVAKLNKGLAVIGKGLAFAIEQQARVLKGIQSDMDEIAARPQKRQARLTVVEKAFGNGDADPSEGLPESHALMLEKSFAAVKAGKIGTQDAARLESAYNRLLKGQTADGEMNIVKALWRKINA